MYKNVNLDNQIEVEKLINDVLKPYFVKQNSEYKYQLKKSLAYYLTTLNFSLEDIIDSNLLPFDSPEQRFIFQKSVELLFWRRRL